MNFIAYGNKNNKSLLFIHGLASTADLCFKPILPFLENYCVIFCEMDGHCASKPNEVTSMAESIDKIENYIINEINGSVYGLCGFSMGGTIAVEMIARRNISVEKLFLDAAITLEMGLRALPFTFAFIVGSSRIINKKPIPKFILEKIMGKNNNNIVEMIYSKITKKTIQNVCKYIYHYKIPESLRKFTNPVLFIRGSEEPIPTQSEKNLKEYLPQMETKVFQGMGHGQLLHEHPKEYANRLKDFMQ